ncbi:MAG TPA: hypothetical protein VEO00_08845 [Actinomycetota bacterium]|nr:hypothetical protein [Actinomycetota bacterium]
MNTARPSLLRRVLALVAFGLLAGGVVATGASLVSRDLCGDEVGAAAVRACDDLVRTLSIRTGLLAGVVSVLMGLLVLGLIRTARQDEEDRRIRRREDLEALQGRIPPASAGER